MSFLNNKVWLIKKCDNNNNNNNNQAHMKFSFKSSFLVELTVSNRESSDWVGLSVGWLWAGEL